MLNISEGTEIELKASAPTLCWWCYFTEWKKYIYHKENTEALLHGDKCVDLEANSHNLYVLKSRHQNAGENHNVKMDNKSFETVAKFGYFETRVRNQNCTQKEIKSRL